MHKRLPSPFKRLARWFRGRSITVQLSLVVGLVCLLSVCLLSYNTYSASKGQITKSYAQSASLLLGETLEKLDSKFMLVESIVYSMSQDPRVLRIGSGAELDAAGLDAYFSGLIELSKYDSYRTPRLTSDTLVDDILFIGDRDIFISRQENFSSYNIRDLLEQESFVQARNQKGRIIWTDCLFNPTARLKNNLGERETALSNHFLLLSFLVSHQPERNVGYVAVSINLENLSKLIDNAGAPGGFFVVDRQGRVLASSDRARLLTPLSEDPQTMELLLSPAPVSFLKGRCDGEDCYLSAAPLSINGWRLALIQPEREITAATQRILFSTVLTGLICFSFLMLFCALILGGITKPVKRIVEAIREIRCQGPRRKAEVDGCREVRELCTEYNFMLLRIDQLLLEVVEEQKALQKSQLKTFRAQINPHFLYNTLDSIKWLIKSGDYEKSERLTTALSSFFRLGLSGGNEEVPLGDELRHAAQYLEIQKVRLSGGFDYLIDCDADLESMPTPKLILQPIAENAVLHGFSGLSRHGVLRVSVRTEGESLLLEVTDNGCGMSAQKLSELTQRLGTPLSEATAGSHGYALRNVSERLRLSYGPDCGLSFYSVEGKGTRVTVRLPARLPGQ